MTSASCDNAKSYGLLYPSPERIYDFFKQINAIPRPSWHEEKATEFLVNFAIERKLEYKKDNWGCVVIKKKATPGYENLAPVVLLAHTDMVCVNEKEKTFDPLLDGIESYNDNGWIKAKGTSLGADNGIGMAMMLAVLDSDTIRHPALECLFTTNEEDGMTGACNMSPDFISGNRIINVDSEDFDIITIGSAAAYLQFAHIDYTLSPVPNDYTFYHLEITGALGGHSGLDINKNRCNVNKAAAEFLHTVGQSTALLFGEINGGEANNAIPSHFSAMVGVPVQQADSFEKEFIVFTGLQKDIFKESDPNLLFTLCKTDTPIAIIPKEQTDNLLRMVYNCPCGTLKMSEKLPGCPETSNNLGMIKTEAESIFVSTYSRSFIDAHVVALGNEIKQLYDAAGARNEVIMFAPGWDANTDSPLLKTTVTSFETVLGFTPTQTAYHFALESGYFMQRNPQCEIVSIGPKIIDVHSLQERVDISTIDRIWYVLIDVLQNIDY